MISIIQGDSGETVNIWGSNINGHCEKKNRFNMCLITNGYRDRTVWICKHNSIANGNKEKLLNVNLIVILIEC